MGKKKTKTKATTDQVMAALRARYTAPQHAFLAEVPNATGASAARRVDALAMGLWPSRGLLLEGFEVKVSRSDWLREVKKPEKAEPFVRFLDRFWLVVGDEEIVNLEEVPLPWGVMALRGKRLHTIKDAEALSPEPPTRPFLAALMRQIYDQGSGADVAKLVEQQVGEVRREANKRLELWRESERTNRRDALTRLQGEVKAFEERSGMSIRDWNAPKVGPLIKCLSADTVGQHLPHLTYMRQRVKKLAALFDEIDGLTDDIGAEAIAYEEKIKGEGEAGEQAADAT